MFLEFNWTFGAMKIAHKKFKFCLSVARFLTVARKQGQENRKKTRKTFDM